MMRDILRIYLANAIIAVLVIVGTGMLMLTVWFALKGSTLAYLFIVIAGLSFMGVHAIHYWVGTIIRLRR